MDNVEVKNFDKNDRKSSKVNQDLEESNQTPKKIKEQIKGIK